MAKARHLLIGTRGERRACAYLRILGYRIIDRNAVLDRDELDIIAFDTEDNVLVFVEVKSRSDQGTYETDLNFTDEKQIKMQRAIEKWIIKNEYEAGYRIDLITVAGGRVTNHLEDVPWL